MSSIAAFKRCRKAYQIGYEYLLEPLEVPDYITRGSGIHKLLENAANGKPLDPNDPWFPVVDSYLKEIPLPPPGARLLVEEPIYTLILPAGSFYGWDGAKHEHPDVYIRTTYDLAYERDGGIILRDYKSFEKAPTMDFDLTFQNRIYIATGMVKFQTENVMFEIEAIRATPPFTYDKSSKWKPSECYINTPAAYPKHEILQTWDETKDVIRDMLRAKVEGRYYREDLQVGPHSCTSCLVKKLCLAEMRAGQLDDQDIKLLAKPREPEKMPA